MTSLAGTVKPDLHQLYLGQSSLVSGLCTPGPQGTCSWLKVVRCLLCHLVCSPRLHLMVAPDTWLPTKECLLLTCSVSSPLGLKSLAWEEKEGFFYPGRSQAPSNSGPNAYAEVSTISIPHCQVHPQNPSLVNSSPANMYLARIPNNMLCGWM